jgi:rod shape-determining protein MreC
MQQIFNFVIRNKNFLLFLLLFAVSLALTIQSHAYHKSQFISSANRLTGGTYDMFSSFTQYFGLKKENLRLQEENMRLRKQLFNQNDSNNYNNYKIADSNFTVVSGRVFKNSYNRNYNFITLNKGLKDSVQQDYGVITDKGIVGIVDQVSQNYSRVISILNRNSKINAQLKATGHFGTLLWNGNSPNTVQLVDVSQFAKVAVNDTVITGGQSAIFPKGIGIGVVTDIQEDPSGDTYLLDVRLFNDMTNLGFVYIIGNNDRTELIELERIGDE